MTPDDMRRQFQFYRLHIPTGQITEGVSAHWTRFDFLEALNKWNAQGPDWKYWTEDAA